MYRLINPELIRKQCSYSLQLLLKILGIKDFAPSNWLMKWLADTICDYKLTDSICSDVIFLLCGFDTKNLNSVSVDFLYSLQILDLLFSTAYGEKYFCVCTSGL